MDSITYLKVKNNIDEVLVAAENLAVLKRDPGNRRWDIDTAEDRLDNAILNYIRARKT